MLIIIRYISQDGDIYEYIGTASDAPKLFR